MANVQEYIDRHGLQKKVEDVLNACVKGKPDEPLSFMVRHVRALGARALLCENGNCECLHAARKQDVVGPDAIICVPAEK